MRLVTFNIHHGTVGRDGPVDPDRLGAVCASLDADVLTLNEVDRGTWRTGGVDLTAAVASAARMSSVFGPSRWFPGGEYGNAVLVRGSITSWAVAPLPRVPRWRRWQERRTLLVARVLLDGRALTVATTHLDTHQAVSAVQLDHALRIATGVPGTLAVTGDLNRFRPTVEPAANAVGLRYVVHGPTNPIPDPHRRIDHCLLSSDLAVRRVEVRATEMSDHAALIVDVDRGRASGAGPR